MNEKEENNNLNKPEGNPFSLPGNYFSSFSERMKLKIELSEELKEFKILSSIDKRSPFIVPQGYFAGSEVKGELSGYETLNALKKEMPFEVPGSYFEISLHGIQAKKELADELGDFAVLSSLEKQNSFGLPENYFEEFGNSVIDKLSPEPKIIRFENVLHLVFNKKTAYAIAALLVISLGIYYYSTIKTDIVSSDCNTVACLDKKDVSEIHLQGLDNESLLELADPETLSKNLEENLSDEKQKDDKTEKEEFILENADVNAIVDEM